MTPNTTRTSGALYLVAFQPAVSPGKRHRTGSGVQLLYGTNRLADNRKNSRQKRSVHASP